ncbi:MAG: hypothetical protein K9W43_05140 [Candidatus Thorarchaeota archaeon]|nr:hypothetical protein [Candidatus Thorarchaeota archaeon]
MADYSLLHKQARHDIRVCIQAWSETFRGILGDSVEYMYAKGSAVKAWDSPIDYVPMLSDVDIHIYFRDDTDFFTGHDDPLQRSLDILVEHERRFKAIEPHPLHYPRSQITVLNTMMHEEWYTPPRLADIRPVFGTLPPEKQVPPEKVRFVDRWRIEEYEPIVQGIPLSLVDRSGPDYWVLVRRLSWRVSPAPFRLLTQSHPDPLEVWSWNRTRILQELEARGYDDLASHYRQYYEAGWDLFLSGLESTTAYRQIVAHGYHVLQETLRILGRL